jgi:hypothetical protein
MANQANNVIQSVADLERQYPEFVRQIRQQAAAEERLRMKQLYCAVPVEDGQKLMEQAAERSNAARRARSH